MQVASRRKPQSNSLQMTSLWEICSESFTRNVFTKCRRQAHQTSTRGIFCCWGEMWMCGMCCNRRKISMKVEYNLNKLPSGGNHWKDEKPNRDESGIDSLRWLLTDSFGGTTKRVYSLSIVTFVHVYRWTITQVKRYRIAFASWLLSNPLKLFVLKAKHTHTLSSYQALRKHRLVFRPIAAVEGGLSLSAMKFYVWNCFAKTLIEECFGWGLKWKWRNLWDLQNWSGRFCGFEAFVGFFFKLKVIRFIA